MPITNERFAQGLTYDAYKAQMTRNQDRFVANQQTLELPADELAFWAGLPAPLHVLVLAEDWCGDVIANLPVLGGLAAASGKLDIRVFLRDQNPDIMDQYMLHGEHRAIPVFVFFDQSFNEIGHWIERPARVSELMGAMRDTLFDTDPLLRDFPPETSPGQLPEAARDRLMQAFGAFREEHRALSDREVLRELRALVEHGAAQTTAATPTPAPQPARNALPTQPSTQANGARQPVKVSITYCASCGYEPQTLALVSALMYEFVYDLASIELIPWQDGAFDVVVGGELVHSMYRDGGFPEHDTIIRAVRQRLGQPVTG